MAKTTHGTTIHLGAVKLAGVTNVKLPNMTRGMIGTTDHDTIVAKEFMPEDLYELGDCVITMNYVAGSTTDDACLAAMTASAESPIAVTALVKAAAGTEDVDFNAFGTTYEIGDLPSGSTDKQTCTLTLKPTGARGQAPTV
ncbi:MAG: hypothetical protein CMO29_02180 [Tistrella sp.]|nr:hypothetical protein [Tistrella sp.]|tara:strand:- start:7528 stop:7950 length:423 start_codon:yes stop_codon:yes gene_type:complete